MGKHVVRVLVVWAAATVFPGCGEDEEAPRDPLQSCQDFVDAWCNKSSECFAPSERARIREDCLFLSALDLHCDEVAHVSDQYSACIDAIVASKCVLPDGFPTPNACRGVLIQ